MGCDIHLATEVRLDGRWRYVPSFVEWNSADFDWENDPAGRFYELFALLAGVRGVDDSPPALFPYRGIPEDAQRELYQRELYDDTPWLGEHSQTWASYEELRGVDWGDLAECAFRRWIDGQLTDIANEHGPENVRVLMGFDS